MYANFFKTLTFMSLLIFVLHVFLTQMEKCTVPFYDSMSRAISRAVESGGNSPVYGTNVAMAKLIITSRTSQEELECIPNITESEDQGCIKPPLM